MSYKVTFEAPNREELEHIAAAYAKGVEVMKTLQGEIIKAFAIPPAPAPEAVVTTTAPVAEELKQKRTRKVTQAPDPVAPLAEVKADAVTDSQAQVDNSASAPSVIPAEAKVPEKGEDTEASTPVPSPATVTFDDMKAKLQAVSAKFPGDEGLAKVSGIIAEFGARKVKEVPADKFADVVAKCDEILK